MIRTKKSKHDNDTAGIPIYRYKHLYESGGEEALQEKIALTAADILNDRVLSWYDEEEVKVLRILTDSVSK
jgi:hypothetical protein